MLSYGSWKFKRREGRSQEFRRSLEGSVVAATVERAGTWRGAACSSCAGLSSMGSSASFRPVGRGRCKQRPSKQWVKPSSSAVAATTERSPPETARGSPATPEFSAFYRPRRSNICSIAFDTAISSSDGNMTFTSSPPCAASTWRARTPKPSSWLT